ncbi:MAG: FecR family protein [Myxococcota bacterium]
MVRTTIITASMAILLLAGSAFAAGRAIVVQGSALVTRDNVRSGLAIGAEVAQGDTIEVGDGGYVRLIMQDGSVFDLAAGTRLVLREYSADRTARRRRASIKVWIGRIWLRATKAFGSDDQYTVDSENAVAGVRGTEFIFEVHADGSVEVTVLEGSVALTSKLTQLSELLGRMSRGSVNAAGEMSRSSVTPADVASLRAQSKPKPRLDESGKSARLNTVRERLEVEVTSGPTLEPVEALRGGLDEDLLEEDLLEEDPFEDLDDQIDNPSDPLLNLEPGAGATHIRGRVEVIQP